MSKVIDVFGAAGLLAARLPGYEPREGQVAMALAVERALEKGGHVLADAPTGVGKSLAYLVPAIDHAIRTKSKVIVVTANIGLQEQVTKKDLPFLASVLPEKFSFALAKGRNNYLCASALEKVIAEGTGLLSTDRLVRRALAWAEETKTGDASEFGDGFPPGFWRRLSVSSDECKGPSCGYRARCFSEVAKREVERADVLVTNYHLFFAHLAIRARARKVPAVAGATVDIVLPPASAVIFDEAHKAADVARDFLGFSIAASQVDWLVRGFDHDLGKDAKNRADAFFSQASALRRDRRYRARIRRGQELDGGPLADVLGRVARFYADAAATTGWSDDERAELSTRAKRARALSGQVLAASTLEDHGNVVYFLEESERGAISVKSKPIDVAPFLREELFGQYPTVAATSATLATGKGSGGFAFARRELGAPDAAEDVRVDSPFAWDRQAMVVLPRSARASDPKDPGYPDVVADHVARACDAADGRTLALFTSFRCLERARERLRGFRHRVFAQKDAPARRLVEDFKTDVHSVLLGCETFWAGVDVPGEALSCVVIDRIPFPNPDDAIFDAVSERDRDAFFNYAVPRAIIQMRQGFGRLIRSRDDRGVVVIVDPRIATKGYGRAILGALPAGLRMADEVEDVARFLAESRAA